MNNTSETGQPVYSTSEAERMFKVIFYVLLFIAGLVGNLLVVAIVKAKNKHRTVNDYFILNLAISDLTFLCFALPFYYYELFEKFTKFEFYCKVLWPLMSVTLLVSIFTLTLMAIERCIAILYPFRPRIKKHTLFLAILMVWILSILCMVPLIIVANPVGVYCLETWPREVYRKAYTAVLFVLQFAMPITIIAVAYITIAVTLVKSKVPNRTSVNQRGQVVKQKTRADNIHIIRTVAIIVVLFVICMLPNQIAWILVDFGGDDYKNLSEKFWLLAEALMFFHSCVNPVIYGSLTRQFRDGYIKYLRFICCCGQRYSFNGSIFSDRNIFSKSRGTCASNNGASPYVINWSGRTTSSRYVTSRSPPPSPGRLAASSLRYPSPDIRWHPIDSRVVSSSPRSHPWSVRSSGYSSNLNQTNTSFSRQKSSADRPASPLIIGNKEALDDKRNFIGVHKKEEKNMNLEYDKNNLLSLKTDDKNGKGEISEGTVLKNQIAHDTDTFVTTELDVHQSQKALDSKQSDQSQKALDSNQSDQSQKALDSEQSDQSQKALDSKQSDQSQKALDSKQSENEVSKPHVPRGSQLRKISEETIQVMHSQMTSQSKENNQSHSNGYTSQSEKTKSCSLGFTSCFDQSQSNDDGISSIQDTYL